MKNYYFVAYKDNFKTAYLYKTNSSINIANYVSSTGINALNICETKREALEIIRHHNENQRQERNINIF